MGKEEELSESQINTNRMNNNTFVDDQARVKTFGPRLIAVTGGLPQNRIYAINSKELRLIRSKHPQ